ncbi:Hypothetical protein, putative [Bodo saltans]|uniref:BTB domain-containing protein n=1 Tax=Bodo saltans TaxID=75058 RepID=A0A0S4JR56_BODSA|nr:Hypothetical protein, putative [Bodo saltans]|eukprot:CUG93981.1 Hypothetical protein, putative [Bodo saltans]
MSSHHVDHANHSSHFAFLLDNTLCSDVILRTEDSQLIPAHKAILCAVSMAFRGMFGNDQCIESKSSEVTVPYPATSFRVALRYMYTGVVEFAEEPLQILDIGSYYCLDALRDAAVHVLKEKTTADNTFTMLETALQFQCPALRDHCITLIRQHNTEVLQNPQWVGLSLELALLLLQETVIASELGVLGRCVDWCRHNADPSSSAAPAAGGGGEDNMINKKALLQFLQFIDFTKMTKQEVDEVESMGCVPLEVLYRSIKNHCLGLGPLHTPRKGGIILQWEMSATDDIAVKDNHVCKVSSDYMPRTVYAINRFSKGRHYFTFTIENFRSPHDCLVGVSNRALQMDFHFEPCCNTICSPPGTVVVAPFPTSSSPTSSTPLIQDHRCVIGVCADFERRCIEWYNHVTKQLLYTATPPAAASDDDGSASAFDHALVPSVTLYHKTNGGVILSESTSFLDDRSQVAMPMPSSGLCTPKGKTSSSSVSASSPNSSTRRSGLSGRGLPMF